MWIQFESNAITEEYFFENFFKDKRPVDAEHFVDMLRKSYAYLPGMQDVLQRLKDAGHTMKTFSNYPVWYRYIEEELALSRYLDWTYVSCTGPLEGKRKPSPESFACVMEAEEQRPIIFIDDRESNVQGARDAGMHAILFSSAQHLEETLRNEYGVWGT
jgi:FMN hydrolase / 5-amino-6-(5-phospho-D-ribitylamino)uracil phosphatase